MRRLAYLPVALSALALLTGCGTGLGGGTSSGVTPNAIIFSNGTNQVNGFAVSASGGAPALVLAEAVQGSGGLVTIIPGQKFTWAATYLANGTPFSAGASGQVQGTCGAPSQTTGINSLLQQGPTFQTHTNAYPLPAYGGAWSQLAETPGSNPPVYTQHMAQIYVGPPLIPLTPSSDPSLSPSPFPITPIPGTGTGPGNYVPNYCLNLVATHVGSGIVGSTVIVVVP